VYLARLASLTTGHSDLLSGPEAVRATQFRLAADRNRFVLATVVVRTAVGELLGCPPATVALNRSCEYCGRQHGRPRLPGTDLQVSISHSGDVVAVALTDGCPVGVDVEAVTASEYESLLPRVCTEAERPYVRTVRDFYTIWTRKEAVLKATGQGLRTPMTSVTVTSPGARPALLEVAGTSPACQLADIPAGEGYAAAAAVLTPAAVTFDVRAAGPLLAG
jgi:4'-phosphopantetheinyl transferase